MTIQNPIVTARRRLLKHLMGGGAAGCIFPAGQVVQPRIFAVSSYDYRHHAQPQMRQGFWVDCPGYRNIYKKRKAGEASRRRDGFNPERRDGEDFLKRTKKELAKENKTDTFIPSPGCGQCGGLAGRGRADIARISPRGHKETEHEPGKSSPR